MAAANQPHRATRVLSLVELGVRRFPDANYWDLVSHFLIRRQLFASGSGALKGRPRVVATLGCQPWHLELLDSVVFRLVRSQFRAPRYRRQRRLLEPLDLLSVGRKFLVVGLLVPLPRLQPEVLQFYSRVY